MSYNFGHSSRQQYDECFYSERVKEITDPMMYRMNPQQINNCNKCLNKHGPIGGHGVSSMVNENKVVDARQQLTDVESILTNRNVLNSKCSKNGVNPVDFKNSTIYHNPTCNDYLDASPTRLVTPVDNFRGMSINRFENLPRDAQSNVFWNFAVNTKLEAKDNYTVKLPSKLYTNSAVLSKTKPPVHKRVNK